VNNVSNSRRRLSFAESSLILEDPQTLNVEQFGRRRNTMFKFDEQPLKSSGVLDPKVHAISSVVPESPEMPLNSKTSESNFI